MRAGRLSQLGGIEHRVYAKMHGQPRVFAFADEDVDRSTADKTSAVHFLRFEFTAAAVSALREGAGLSMGIDDPRLLECTLVAATSRAALLADFGS